LNFFNPSGPATIVWNESGHRLDEEEPDSAPEDEGTPILPQSDQQTSRPASRARSRESPIPTPGYATPSNSKGPSALEHVLPDALNVIDLQSPSIERTPSKMESPPYTSHADADRDSGQQESGKEKGKAKGTKNKKKSLTTEPDAPKLADPVSAGWDPLVSPNSPVPEASLPTTNTGPSKEKTTAVLPKEKDQTTTKTAKGKTSKTSKDIVKSVDFILPNEESTVRESHRSPTNKKSPKVESPKVEFPSSHPTHDAAGVLLDEGTNSFPELANEDKNAKQASPPSALPPADTASHFNNWGSEPNGDSWSNFTQNATSNPADDAFLWSGTNANTNLDLGEGAGRVDDITDELWNNGSAFIPPQHSVEPEHATADPTHPEENHLTFDNSELFDSLDFSNPSTLFPSIETGGHFVEKPSPKEDAFPEPHSSSWKKPGKSPLSSSQPISTTFDFSMSNHPLESAAPSNEHAEDPVLSRSPVQHNIELQTSPTAEGGSGEHAQPPASDPAPLGDEENPATAPGAEGADSDNEGLPFTSKQTNKKKKGGGGGGGDGGKKGGAGNKKKKK
jgi:hypothetical protein